jgi:DNA processing protein
VERGERQTVREIGRGDDDFPQALREIQRPPESIFTIGDETILRMAPNRLVAIVGTRDASPYGVRVAAALADAFTKAGVGVVSGLARGIDSAAHRAALEAGGKTIAVMGTGVDVPYPVGHRRLHAEIAAKGLLVSENEPGTPAGPGCFPRRNRIIAGLARVTIVVEAPYKSGAINTATQALDAGRVVAAIPGPIDSPRSAGANLLLRDGAQIIHSIDDALMLYGLSRARKDETPALGGVESTLWDALAAGPASAELLTSRSGLNVRQVLEGIVRLELCGMVQQQANGSIERIKIA